MKLLDVPSLWHVRLTDGGLIHVWADGYSVVDDCYVFDVMAKVPLDYQAQVDVTSKAPPNHPENVCVAVARIPTSTVQELHTARIYGDRCCDCIGD
ncbi:hypothetical protein ACFWU3_05080 [Streptomyces sp. NPDC058685]|uniref:hypothetical protein n=1 Tax=Streptomyces sp. NPDC058685 TaxID=3346598 RepID=UPI0036529174